MEKEEVKRWYFVCKACDAKWFAWMSIFYCPRCGRLTMTRERYAAPWAKE